MNKRDKELFDYISKLQTEISSLRDEVDRIRRRKDKCFHYRFRIKQNEHSLNLDFSLKIGDFILINNGAYYPISRIEYFYDNDIFILSFDNIRYYPTIHNNIVINYKYNE